LEYVLQQVEILGLRIGVVEFDVTLARGLNYYTGAIFEVNVHDVKMGSICGGGRYDDLTGLFGMKGLSGVGVSFGADRIYDVLTELNLFPEDTDQAITLLFTNFGVKEEQYCMKIVHSLRQKGLDCELYPVQAKLQKQMKYANDRKAKFVAMIGDEELKAGTILLKNMDSGEQNHVFENELFDMMLS
jgi:histidyl-tRNA synthetase